MSRSPYLAGAGLAALLGMSSYVLWFRTSTPAPSESPKPIDQPSSTPSSPTTCTAIDGGEHAGDHLTSIIFLYDASKSYNTKADSSPFMGAASRFPEMGLALEKHLPSPHRFVLNTIGTLSLTHRPVCDIYMPQRTLFRRSCSEEDIKNLFLGCRSRLVESPGEEDTDITGALAYAASALESHSDVVRGIVMFTDLEEDVPDQSHIEAHPDLAGTCVAVFYDFVPSDALDPDKARRRATVWEKKIMGYGAKRVFVRNSNSLTDRELAQFFDDCR